MRTFIIIQKNTGAEIWDVEPDANGHIEPRMVGYGMVMPDCEAWERFTANSSA